MSVTSNHYKQKGIESFLKFDFINANFCFSEALRIDPNDKETLLFLMLVNHSNKDEALFLFQDYQQRLEAGFDKKSDLIEKLTFYLEKDLHIFEDIIKDKIQDEFLQTEDGINYEEFLASVEQRGDFRKAFEDIMFSTRIIISSKEDFVQFLGQLIDNDFIEMSLKYLESATDIFPNEEKFKELLVKALKRQNS